MDGFYLIFYPRQLKIKKIEVEGGYEERIRRCFMRFHFILSLRTKFGRVRSEIKNENEKSDSVIFFDTWHLGLQTGCREMKVFARLTRCYYAENG